MKMIKNYLSRKKIKAELMVLVSENIDLKNKKINELKKTDLDSIDMMNMLQVIEKKWGKLNLADLYQAQDFDDIVILIQKNQS